MTAQVFARSRLHREHEPMNKADLENLWKFSIADDPFADGLALVPQSLLAKAHAEIVRRAAERLKLDRRIHNQRRSNRETWEIVEMRRKWLGTGTTRERYTALLKRHRDLLAKCRSLEAAVTAETGE